MRLSESTRANLVQIGVWIPMQLLITILFNQDLPYNFETQTIPEDNYDFVVVGAGAAGCVVGARLAEVGASVLILEHGKSASQESTLAFAGGSNAMLPNNAIYSPITKQNQEMLLGRVVGGGTTVNSLVSLRGSKLDYDDWARLGNEHWDYNSLLPYFKISEDFTGYQSPETESLYGKGGRLPIKMRNNTHPVTKFLIEAGKKMGYQEIDGSSPTKAGISVSHINAENGIRKSTSEAFLRPIMNKANILVRTRAEVTKILVDASKRAYGVQYIYNGKTRIVKANKEVILSAGAISSPKLLLLSGIGPHDHLQKHRIKVEVPLQGVGRNLQDHHHIDGLKWIIEDDRRNNLRINFFRFFKQFASGRTGRLSEPIAIDALIFANLNDKTNANGTDICVDVTVLQKVLQVNVILNHPKSIGTVELRSGDHKDDPNIDSNILAVEKDMETALKGIILTFKFIQSPIMKEKLRPKLKIKSPEPCMKFSRKSKSFWKCFIKQNLYTYYHPTGTCKMGPTADPMAVVNSELQVRGVKRLRVIDGSVMPKIVGVNTMRTIIMIAEKGADMIKREHGYPTLVKS